MWDIGQIVVLMLFASTVFVLGWGIVSYLTHRPRRSRSQRTMTEDSLDTAADALADPDMPEGDHRPRRRRLWKPHWTTLRGRYFQSTTKQDD